MLLTDKELVKASRAAIDRVWPPSPLVEQVAVWRLVVTNRPRASAAQITTWTFDIYNTIVAERAAARAMATKERRSAGRSKD